MWRATDFSNGRAVALKRFTGALASVDAERVRAEIELLAAHALHGHPNVVEVLGGSADPEPHVVMEYLDGGDLGREIAGAGRLSIERTLDIGIAVANALAAAADAGVIHGDVKPSNVLLSSTGAIKLADFNVARVTGFTGGSVPGSMLVSFAYAAPEVWDGEVTATSDLYALGCVLYECLTGHPPFTGSYATVFRAHIESPPDLTALPADTPPELTALIGELLEKDRSRRPTDPYGVAVRLTDMRTAMTPVETKDLWPAFGPWLIEKPHPVTPWAWLVRHQQSGRVATVELFFGDQSVGDRLRRAVDENHRLVPLGAEVLIETNRLLLRPDQSLGRPTPDGWIFWVAREEIPAPDKPVRLDGPELATAVDRIRRLILAASGVGLALDLSPANLMINEDGRIHVRRPGIAPVAVPEDANALGTLRQTVVPALVPLVARAGTLAQLSDELGRGASTTDVWGTPQTLPAASILGSQAPTIPVTPSSSGATSATATLPGPIVPFRRASVVRSQRRVRTTDQREPRYAATAAGLLLVLGILILGGIAFLLSGGLGGRPTLAPTDFAVGPPASTPSPITTDVAVVPTLTPTTTLAPTATSLPTALPVPTSALTDPPPQPTNPPPATDPPPQPTNPPPQPTEPPPQNWQVDLQVSDTDVANGERVTITATTNQSVSSTPYVIQIFNPDTGFIHWTCGNGTTCGGGARRENITVSYQARVSAADGSNVQALSERRTVTWQ